MRRDLSLAAALLCGASAFAQIYTTAPVQKQATTTTPATGAKVTVGLGSSVGVTGCPNACTLTISIPLIVSGVTTTIPVVVTTPAPVTTPTATAPTASLASGSYTGTQSLTLSSVVPAAQIYYTTDGTDPGVSSTKHLYTMALSVMSSETVKALVNAAGYNASPVTTVALTINTAVVVSNPPAPTPVAGQNTWYVRPDGGTRYSAKATVGQCDGLGDAAYPGTGANQHCAFNDIRLLYQDGSYALAPRYMDGQTAVDDPAGFPAIGWVMAGGDTVIIRGSIASGATRYRAAGWSNPNGPDDTTVPAGQWDRRGWQGDNVSGMPTPPAGTAAHHTRILGENWANCHAASARTPIMGGWGVGSVFNLSASYIDFQCFDISDQADGKASGTDYAINGIGLANTADHLTITDVRAHGLGTFGMVGSSGDGSVFSYMKLDGNQGGGWSADANDGYTGLGSLLVQHYEISWNGCNEEYPVVDTLPYHGCIDQSHGGYGDGFGTSSTDITPNPVIGQAYNWRYPDGDTYSNFAGTLPPGLSMSTTGVITGTPTTAGVYVYTMTDNNNNKRALQFAVGSQYPQGWQAHFDQGTVMNNTQDGLDALHLTGQGSSMTVTKTLAYGNMGQQVKVGGQQGTIEDNLLVGNCKALSNAIPGTPSGYNANLSDFCRAGNQPVLMTAGHASTTKIRHNTIEGNGALLIGYACDGLSGPCDATSLIDLRDNVLLGNPDPSRGNPGANYLTIIDTTYTTAAACNAAPDGHHNWITDGATGCANDVFYNTGSYNRNNVYWQVKDAATDNNGQSNVAVAPGLKSEIVPAYGAPDMSINSTASAVYKAGAVLTDLLVDYDGNSFLNPPSIGGLEFGSTVVPYLATQP